MHQQQSEGRLAQCAKYWFLGYIVVATFVAWWPSVVHLVERPSIHNFNPGDAYVEHVARRQEEIAQAFEHSAVRPSIQDVVRARATIMGMRLLVPNAQFDRVRDSHAIDRIVNSARSGLSDKERGIFQFELNAAITNDEARVRDSAHIEVACLDQRDGGGACRMAEALKPEGATQQFQEMKELFAWSYRSFQWLYLLAIPFVVVGFWLRIVRRGRTMHDYIQEHLGDFLVSLAVWPLALLSEFPLWTPWTSLRRRVEERLSAMDFGQMPVWQQGFACAAVVIGVVLASLVPARSAFAQQAEVKLHGFVDADTDHTGGARLNHAWVQVAGPVADGAKVDIVVDPASKALSLRQAAATFALSDSTGVRVGQLPTSTALIFDSPATERVGGGAWAAGTFASFFDLGVEGFGKFGNVTARASVLSGSGPNKPDGNKAKDGMLGVSWRPDGSGGASVLEATVQSGDQPDGWRTRALAHGRLAVSSGGALLDLTGAFQRWHGVDGWGLSSLVVVPMHARFETAVAYDALRMSGAAPVEHVVRGQATLIGFSQSLRAAIMARWSSATGWLGNIRLQFVF